MEEAWKKAYEMHARRMGDLNKVRLVVQACEEIGELLQCISKLDRATELSAAGIHDRDAIIDKMVEELADVHISVKNLLVVVGDDRDLEAEIKRTIGKKTERWLTRERVLEEEIR